MIQHVVLFGISKDTPMESLLEARDRLHALVGKIPGLVSLKADTDIGIDGNCGLGLIAHLENRSALEVFSKDPDHLAVADYISNFRTGIAIMDSEILN
jgi:hypothetical protein